MAGELVEAARSAWFITQLRIAQRDGDLVERVAARFKRRGWPQDDRMHVATFALCCVLLRAPEVPVRILPASDDPPCWAKIVGKTPANMVVEALELSDLLKKPSLTIVQK